MKNDFDSKAKPVVTPEQRRIVNDELLKGMRLNDYQARVDLCLQKGGDIDTSTWDNRTPLMIAVTMNSVARVDYVLTKDPDLFKKDKDGKNVFDLANKIEDFVSRQKIMDRLLRALPDGVTLPGQSAPNVTAVTEEDDGISVSKPIRYRGKPPPPGGGTGGGFNL